VPANADVARADFGLLLGRLLTAADGCMLRGACAGSLLHLPTSPAQRPSPSPCQRPAHTAHLFLHLYLTRLCPGLPLQLLPLTASVSHPRLAARPAALDYGLVHPKAPKPLHIILYNPTKTDATWSVAGGVAADAPPASSGAGASTSASAGEGAVRVGSFLVRPGRGVLPGRGLGMPRQQQVEISFCPAGEQAADEQLVFKARRGQSVAVAVRGQGTFDEAQEWHAAVMRARAAGASPPL